MAIKPDTKNWTWVLERSCDECGFDASGFAVERTGAAVRANALAWSEVLSRPEVAVRTRADRWSALEYACHVRDVLRVYDRRLELMLTQNGPHYENWDQDETAITDQYAGQDPAAVSAQLSIAAGELAERFDGVHDDDWNRTGFRSDGAAFTVQSFARYFIHDPIHHLWDVTP